MKTIDRLHPSSFVKCNDLLVAARYEPILRAHQLDSLDALFDVASEPGALARVELLSKPGLSPWRQRLRLTLQERGQPHTFYLKRFLKPPRSFSKSPSRDATVRERAHRISLAAVEWAWLHRLAREGIACAEPVALGEEFDGSREVRSAILIAAVPGLSLETWVRRWDDSDRETMRNLLAPLAGLVARLHRLGYVHRDLYLSHVFWDRASPIDSSLHLIDLQRVMRPRWRVRGRIIKDLAALNFSAPIGVVSAVDRVRWLKHYLGVPKLDASVKRLAYLVVGKTLRIARRERRRSECGMANTE